MSYKYHKKFFKNLSEYSLVLKEIRMRNYENILSIKDLKSSHTSLKHFPMKI